MAYRSPPRAVASKEGSSPESPEQSAPEPSLKFEQSRGRNQSLAFRPPTPPKPKAINFRPRSSTHDLPKTTSLPNNAPNHVVSNGVHPSPVQPSLSNGSRRKPPRPASTSQLHAAGLPTHPPALLPKPTHLMNAPQKRKTSKPEVLLNGEGKSELN